MENPLVTPGSLHLGFLATQHPRPLQAGRPFFAVLLIPQGSPRVVFTLGNQSAINPVHWKHLVDGGGRPEVGGKDPYFRRGYRFFGQKLKISKTHGSARNCKFQSLPFLPGKGRGLCRWGQAPDPHEGGGSFEFPTNEFLSFSKYENIHFQLFLPALRPAPQRISKGEGPVEVKTQINRVKKSAVYGSHILEM